MVNMFDRDTLNTIRRLIDNYPDRIVDVLNSLSKNQYSSKKHRMHTVKLNVLNVTWVLIKFNIQLKNNACTQSNSICWVWLEFD